MARWIQRLLLAVGLVILGYCGAYWFNMRFQQSHANRELDRILSNRQTPASRPTIPDGGLVGRVEIPKLHLSAVVFQGTDNNVLARGVGHVDSSALPGSSGNVVLAAHRDTFFRSLRNIQTGDTIRVATAYGTRNYVVASTEIVDPTQTRVMAPTPSPTLTLITCYPFYFIGHAPKRFIVHARDLEAPVQPSVVAQAAKTEIVNSPLSEQDSENLIYTVKASDLPSDDDASDE